MYGNHGENLISGKNYESDSQDIFKTLSQAVEDTSLSLEEFTGFRSIDVDDYFNTDIAAYEYYLKGKSYYQTNKPEELQLAERMFEKALEIDPTLAYAPNDLETLLLLSLVNMDLRKYTVAMATLHRAIELAPDYGRAFYNLAAVYMKPGVIDLALKNFELAVKYKGDPNAYTDGAYAYIVNGEYDKAKKLLDKSIDEECFTFIAKYLLGVAEKMKGNEEQALSFFKESVLEGWKCVAEDKENIHIKAYLAISLAAAGEKEEALALLKELISETSEDGEILLNFARTFALLGDTEKVNQYLKSALAAHTGPTEKQINLDFHFRSISIDIRD